MFNSEYPNCNCTVMGIRCFCVSLITVTAILHTCVAVDNRIVDSKAGKFKGIINTVTFGEVSKQTILITSYLGISYAEAPTGERRFRKPVPKAKLKDVFEAVKYGPSCPQNELGFVVGETSEDCLNLNIHTPDVIGGAQKFAVMIWIHGGGFILGNGRVFGGHLLAGNYKVVVVTINYRLGPLGFLNIPNADADMNVGLYDQHLAIKWVQDNIESFGGDPTRITLFGQSAGAVSIIHQLLYPGNEGLFQRAISQSGSANLPSAITLDPETSANNFALKVKCPITSSNEIIKCLRNLNISDLIIPGERFTPCYDDKFVSKQRVASLNTPDENADLPVFKNVDLLMGTNGYEGQIFLPTPRFSKFYFPVLNNYSSSLTSIMQNSHKILKGELKEIFKDSDNQDLLDAASFLYANYAEPSNKGSQVRQVSNMLTDLEFFLPIFKTLQAHAVNKNKTKTYQYEFNELYPFMSRDYWVEGALHSDELPYVFGFPSEMKPFFGNYNDSQIQSQWFLSSTIMFYFTNFAKSGNPNTPLELPVLPLNGSLPIWQPFSTESHHYMHLTSADLEDRQNLNGRRVAFWKDFIPKLTKDRETSTHACVISSAFNIRATWIWSLTMSTVMTLSYFLLL